MHITKILRATSSISHNIRSIYCIVTYRALFHPSMQYFLSSFLKLIMMTFHQRHSPNKVITFFSIAPDLLAFWGGGVSKLPFSLWCLRHCFAAVWSLPRSFTVTAASVIWLIRSAPVLPPKDRYTLLSYEQRWGRVAHAFTHWWCSCHRACHVCTMNYYYWLYCFTVGTNSGMSSVVLELELEPWLASTILCVGRGVNQRTKPENLWFFIGHTIDTSILYIYGIYIYYYYLIIIIVVSSLINS